MTIVAHADQCDVKGTLAHQLTPRVSERRGRHVKGTRARSGRIRGRHTDELDAGGRVEEALPRLIIVAILVARRHITLVDQPHAHA